MRSAIRVAFVAAGLSLPGMAASAQVAHEHGGQPPEQLGKVHFPTSCNAQAQPRFERALALLHSFWWEESGVAFRQVAEADPGCLMAVWGQAMTLRNNPFSREPSKAAQQAAWEVLERSAGMTGGTERERAYLNAIRTYFTDFATVPHGTRAMAYEQAMKALAERFPEDTEATIFYALAVASNASTTDTSFSRQREVGKILEPLWAGQPDHPGLAHYIIHSYDSPRLASLGVEAARRYAEIAPAAYHAHHMPSHIFVRLGMWDETVAANMKSFDASRAMERKQGWTAMHNHRLHTMDYMSYGYLQRGRDAKAGALVAEAAAVTEVIPPDELVSDYAQASIPARYALERNAWREAAALTVRPAKNCKACEAITHFARGLGAARSGDAAAARAEVTALGRLEDELKQPLPYWATLVRAQRLEVAAWVLYASGDTQGAIQMATEAAGVEDGTDKHPVTPGHVLPAREALADLLLEAGRHAEARAAYEAVLKKEPGRARSIFGASRAAELAGDREAARSGYQRYLALMEGGDGQRPELAAAKRALAAR
jgi:tetratricopeptide (TPR) repeat protein